MSKTKDEEVSFLKKSTGGESTKTVSARVPSSVYASFQNAVDVAEKNGYELSITDVIIGAMKMAVKQARKQFGEEAFQTALPLSDKAQENKPASKPQPEPAKPAAPSPAVTPAAGKAVEPAKK